MKPKTILSLLSLSLLIISCNQSDKKNATNTSSQDSSITASLPPIKEHKVIVPVDEHKDIMGIREIKLALLDTKYKKAELLLGTPDSRDDLGHWSKSYAVYYNKVRDTDNKIKHLVLFIRKNDESTKYTASFPLTIEEIYAVSEGDKACFGIHCIQVVQ